MLMEAVGIGAMLLILGAYAANSGGYLDSRSTFYQALNFVGSVMFVAYLSVKQAWPSVALNVVWAAIALVVIVRRLLVPEAEKKSEVGTS